MSDETELAYFLLTPVDEHLMIQPETVVGFACPRCGAMVVDADVHKQWHTLSSIGLA